MGTISDKLMRIINTKEDIRQALISKGYDVPTSIPFKEYAKMILDLPCKVDSFPDIEGIVARYSASGLTNEQMAANPVWVDKTGNGHDLQMKNFAWKGMSGVGGYVADIDEWGTNSTAAYFERNSIKITATFKENVSLGLLYHNIKLRQSCVLKVTGIPEGCDAFLDDRLGNRFYMSEDGVYEIIPSNFLAEALYFSIEKYPERWYGSKLTIEQLPLYPGALVFDGVDDYGTCDNFPILTKEKGYTVVALRQYLFNATDKIRSLVTNAPRSIVSRSTLTFELISSNGAKTNFSFGRGNLVSDFEPNVFSYMTSKSYNGKTITPGDVTESNKRILVGNFSENGEYGSNVAIWELVFLDHDATEEELTKIKDYFVKTYPWLFPDQAWTVVGKTNEDEDRATIANITGNDNNLVLSNFGFAEGSGYGLYKTPFELYPSVQHSSKYSLSFSKFALGDHNLIIAPKQNDLSYDIKVKVTGLKDGVKFKWGWIGTTRYIDITTDGIHMLNKPAFQIRQLLVEFAEDFDPDHVVTIEQIPEYEGYLVTDGVDDKIVSSSFGMGKDFTIVGDWKFIDNKKSGTGLVKGSSFYIYNTMIGLDLYINSGSVKNSLDGIKSINAACSDGRAYDRNWNEILANTGNVVGSGGMLEVSSSGGRFDRIAFKNLAIYPRILSKDDCIKAYNYLQTLKAK
jgi:hypothetical protein